MLLKDDPELVNYAKEFCYYGYELRLFDSPEEKFNELKNIEIKYDETLPGAVFTSGNSMTINRRLTFTDEEWTSGVLYHEFAHSTDIHKDMYTKPVSKLKQYREGYKDKLASKYNSNFEEVYYVDGKPQYRGDVNCPYTYALWGAVLLDEAIAENVSCQMLAIKYKRERVPRKQTFYFMNPPVTVYSDYSEYGLFQSLADKFAKTLFGINNLDELCAASYKEDFVENLIYQHTESATTYTALLKELSLLGTIAFADKYSKGRGSKAQKPIDPRVVRQVYDEAVKFLDDGIEYRDKIDFDGSRRVEENVSTQTVVPIATQVPTVKTKIYLSNGRLYVKKDDVLKYDVNVVKPFLELYGLPQSEFDRVFSGKQNYDIVPANFPLPPLYIECGEYNGNFLYRISEEAIKSLEYKPTNRANNGYVVLTLKEVSDLNSFFSINLLPLNYTVPVNPADFGSPDDNGLKFGM